MAVKTISKTSGLVISLYEQEERWANMMTELYSLQQTIWLS